MIKDHDIKTFPQAPEDVRTVTISSNWWFKRNKKINETTNSVGESGKFSSSSPFLPRDL